MLHVTLDELSRIELLVEAVQTVHVSLCLSAHSPQLEPHRALLHALPQFCQTLHSNVLETVL